MRFELNSSQKIRVSDKLSFKIKLTRPLLISSASLIFFNLISLIFGILDGWSLADFVLLYWLQSLIIGVFQFFKILRVQRLEAVDKSGKKIYLPEAAKYLVAGFFLIHYNGFHLGYFFFIKSFLKVDFVKILPVGGFFLVNHLISFLVNKDEAAIKRRLAFLFGFPYLRVVPMHLLIMFGLSVFGESWASFIIFIFLKISADVLMHLIEHSIDKNKKAINYQY